MALAGITNRANSADYMENVWGNRVRRLYPMRRTLLEIMPVVTEGQGLEFNYHLDRGQGGGGSHGSALNIPPASTEEYGKATFTFGGTTDHTGLDLQILEDASGGKKSAGDIRPRKMDTMAKRFGRENEIQAWLDGSGKRAKITAAASATSFTVDNVQYLHRGIRMDLIRNADGGVGDGAANIQIDFNRTTGVCTIRSPGSLANFAGVNADFASYGLYKHNSYPSASNAATHGLLSAISDANPPVGGSYGGIDRSLPANDDWHANVIDKSGDPTVLYAPEMVHLQEIEDMIRRNGSEEVEGNIMFMMELDVWNRICADLLVDRRYGGEQVKLLGWATGIQFAGLAGPLMKSELCPKNTILAINKAAIHIWESKPASWLSELDNQVWRWIQGTASWAAIFKRRWQMRTAEPRNLGIIRNVAGMTNPL